MKCSESRQWIGPKLDFAGKASSMESMEAACDRAVLSQTWKPQPRRIPRPFLHQLATSIHHPNASDTIIHFHAHFELRIKSAGDRRILILAMPLHPDLQDKAISAAHATASSIAALLLIRYSAWPIPPSASGPGSSKPDYRHLDDTDNLTIHGRNTWANALTAWETAYLIYDTYALLKATQRRKNLRSAGAAFKHALKDSPVAMAHHLLLSSALLVLQTYILNGEEKGMWIITAFILMNGSTPFLHARWWRHQQTGKPSTALDLAFVVSFAAARFAVPLWVLRVYGRYHDIGAWQAYRSLRKTCQVGTGLLVGMNGLWWMVLTFNILKRKLRR